MDNLILEERSSLDEEVRKNALMEAQNLVYSEVPAIPSYFRTTINVANKNVKGLEAEAYNLFYLNTLSW